MEEYFRTDPHAKKVELVIWATAEPDDKCLTLKVDPAQRAVTYCRQ